MTISLEMLLEFMEDFSPEYDSSISMPKSIDGLLFLDNPDYQDVLLSPNCIYLCDNDLLTHIEQAPKTAIFFCIGEKKTASKLSIVYFHNGISLHRIANRYHDILNRFTGWDREFHQKLMHNGTLDELLDLTAQWISEPIEIFDPSFNVIAASRHHDGQVHGFTFSSGLGYTPPEYMSRIQQLNLLSQVQNSVTGIVKPSISGEFSGEKTYNIYRCFKINDKIVGYSTIFCGESVPSQGYQDICELFFQNLDMYFTITQKYDKTTSYMYEYLLSALIRDYQKPDSKWLSDRLQYVKLPKHGVFALIKFDFYRDKKYNGYACSLLQKYFPTLNIFLHEDEVYMLVAMNEGTLFYQTKENLRNIISQTEKQFGTSHHWQCYISNPFLSLPDIYYAHRQCNELQEIVSARSSRSNREYFYEDYTIHHAFYHLEKQYDLHFLIWPLFLEIKKYDREHHTSFIDTLKQYLDNDCNLTRTAKAMHMHRNSVENRLKKIEILFHIDLSSFHILHMFYWTFHLIDYTTQDV